MYRQDEKSLPSDDQESLIRARKSIRCLPFKRSFYLLMNDQAMSANELSKVKNDDLLFEKIKTGKIEGYFIWLIKLGVLRREVDGQGLTSRVRLTPMGRKIITEWKTEILRSNRIKRFIEDIKSCMYL